MSEIPRIADYSIGFVRIGNEGRVLLGSGTLVAVSDQRAILTSGSVLARLPRHGRLGIALRTDLNQISLDAANIEYQSIRIADVEIGLIRLSAAAAHRFDESKRFVDLLLASGEGDSTWQVNGFSSKLTTTELPLDCFDMVMSYTNVTGLHEGQLPRQADRIELWVRGVSETGESLPLDGLVGGGLWRHSGGRDGTDVALSGVVISAPSDEAGVVLCVGPTALEAIRDAFGRKVSTF